MKILGYLVEIYTKDLHSFDNRRFSGLGERYVKEDPIRRSFEKNKKTNVLAVLISQTDRY